MIKLEKTENCITLRTFSKARYNSQTKEYEDKGYLSKPHSGSQTFYVPKNLMLEGLLKTGSLITKDCHSFCKISIFNPDGKNPVIDIELTWLDSNGSNCRGVIERLYIDYQKFLEFISNDNTENLSLLDIDYDINPKVILKSSSNLKNVINNRVVRKKFGKIMMRMKNKQCDKIDITDDWYNEFSFYFAVYTDDKCLYNGGIIFHKDNKNPQDLHYGNYSIHT
jgi:hypothetical protein